MVLSEGVVRQFENRFFGRPFWHGNCQGPCSFRLKNQHENIALQIQGNQGQTRIRERFHLNKML